MHGECAVGDILNKRARHRGSLRATQMGKKRRSASFFNASQEDSCKEEPSRVNSKARDSVEVTQWRREPR